MFYSHTFLAKKGPLGTVWCAAHLQHRLKKSHYTSTDILSTVDEIMYPKVPIALRMSGHLLLGVVRIYSKKVDYLFQDCNVALAWLRKAFSCIEVNLPEDARQAPIQSITLPDTFELDNLELDSSIFEGNDDSHLRSPEDITLTDQIPVGTDPYIAITFDEDIVMGFPQEEEVPDSGVKPMEEDVLPQPVDGNVGLSDPSLSMQTGAPVDSILDCHYPSPNQTEVLNPTEQDPGPDNQTEQQSTLPVDSNLGIQDPGHSNQTEVLDARLNDGSSPQNFPEIEVMRDAVHDFHSENIPPVYPGQGHDTAETNRTFGQVMPEKESPSNMEDMLASGEQSLPFQQHSQPPPASAASPDGPVAFDINASFGHVSPELAIQSSPPVERPQARPRKRRLQLFDSEAITLSNKFMKKALNDSSNLLRKRKNAPCSALDVWRLKTLRKDKLFYEPLITGLSAELCDIYKDLSATHPHLVEETLSEPRVVETPTVASEAFAQPSVADAPASDAFPQPSVPQSPAAPPGACIEPGVAQSPAPPVEAFQDPEVVQSVASTEAYPDPDIARSPAPMPEVDMDIEHLRHDEGPIGSNIISEFMPSSRRDDWTPISANIFGSGMESQAGTSTATEMMFTPSVAPSTGPHGSELETPMTFSEDRIGGGSTRLSDIPELHSAEAEDLYFLEADSHTPTAGSQATNEVDTLSVRTRAVAQYLKRHSPVPSISEDLSGDLSLNKILDGKTRKLCARMFFETLVLKSYGLIDVHQEEAYGDVTLKLTPMLSKSEF